MYIFITSPVLFFFFNHRNNFTSDSRLTRLSFGSPDGEMSAMKRYNPFILQRAVSLTLQLMLLSTCWNSRYTENILSKPFFASWLSTPERSFSELCWSPECFWRPSLTTGVLGATLWLILAPNYKTKSRRCLKERLNTTTLTTSLIASRKT